MHFIMHFITDLGWNSLPGPACSLIPPVQVSPICAWKSSRAEALSHQGGCREEGVGGEEAHRASLSRYGLMGEVEDSFRSRAE